MLFVLEFTSYEDMLFVESYLYRELDGVKGTKYLLSSVWIRILSMPLYWQDRAGSFQIVGLDLRFIA